MAQMTTDEIRELAQAIAQGASRDGKQWRAFVALAKASGYEGRHGGWVWFTRLDSQHPTCQGWQALAQRVVEGRTVLHPEASAVERSAAKPLSLAMRNALMWAFQAELGISRSDKTVARSGIVEAYWIKSGTSVALIDRGLLTIQGTAYGPKDAQGYPTRWQKVHQITAAGCAAIGRSMDEIVAWAWGQADEEYFSRTTLAEAKIMRELPVEIGAVVGWTHRGEPMTGEVRSIFDDTLTIFGSDRTGWSVTLDAIERVIKLSDVRAGINASEAYDFAAIEYAVREDLGDDSERVIAKIADGWGLDSAKIAEGVARAAAARNPIHPKGAPEYAAYEAELKVELAKFAKGEEPYLFGGPEPMTERAS